MREVDEEDQPEQEEKHGADQGKVVAPDLEEVLRDEEGDDDEEKPGDNLRAPVPILDGSAPILRAFDAKEGDGEDGVENAEGELDTMDGDEAEALLTQARDREVVEC